MSVCFSFCTQTHNFFFCLVGFLRIKWLPLGIWDRTRYWGSRWLKHVTACKSWPSGNANVKKVSSLLSYSLFTPNSCFWCVRVADWSKAPDSSFCYPSWCFCPQLCDTGAERLRTTLLPFSWFPVRFWLLRVLEDKKGLIPSFFFFPPWWLPVGSMSAPCSWNVLLVSITPAFFSSAMGMSIPTAALKSSSCLFLTHADSASLCVPEKHQH